MQQKLKDWYVTPQKKGKWWFSVHQQDRLVDYYSFLLFNCSLYTWQKIDSNNDQQLFSVYQTDRTAKTWDLSTGKELTSFPGHPNNVLKVAFCPRTQLVFTVSQSSVRIWDMRRGQDPCIKTLRYIFTQKLYEGFI